MPSAPPRGHPAADHVRAADPRPRSTVDPNADDSRAGYAAGAGEDAIRSHFAPNRPRSVVASPCVVRVSMSRRDHRSCRRPLAAGSGSMGRPGTRDESTARPGTSRPLPSTTPVPRGRFLRCPAPMAALHDWITDLIGPPGLAGLHRFTAPHRSPNSPRSPRLPPVTPGYPRLRRSLDGTRQPGFPRHDDTSCTRP